MKYPKINTLWKRDEKNKFVIIEGDYSDKEFDNINKWNVTEKIDGTNIRIFYEPNEGVPVWFGGRTNKAQTPTFLIEYLQKTFTKELLGEQFGEPKKVILFGEGYGSRIQKGGELYRKDVGFILFDIWLDGWWFKQEDVKEVAEKLKIPSVPSLGIMTKEEIVEYVKSNPNSICATEERVIEGIVARSHPLMLFRNGKPMMFKLKVEDYQNLKDMEE